MGKNDTNIKAVKAGEHIRLGEGPDNRGVSYVVEPACTEKNNGRWICVTHDERFENQLQKDFHINRGKHRLIWLCLTHGTIEEA